MKEIAGTGVALVTPFLKNGDIDYASLEKLINHCIKGGVQYLVSLGTTGETPVLSKEEKRDVFNFTHEITKNRLPVVIGIGGNNTAAIIKDLEFFPVKNAVAILSASPYYNKPLQAGIIAHYKAFAAKAPVPVILYNVPGRTGRNMETATTLSLAKERNIVAIKEASGDMQQCMEILKDKPNEFMVISGDDGYALPQIACGMEGVISVVANAYPKEYSAMIAACLKYDFNKATRINNKLMPAYSLMFEENNPAGVKAFLSEMGIINNNLRLPLLPVTSATARKIRAYING